VKLTGGGALAQVTVDTQILKENEIEVYEKNTKSKIFELVAKVKLSLYTP
jgi:hypothetical protein